MGLTKTTLTFPTEKAHRTQLFMAKRIVCEDILPSKIQFIAGVDVAYTKELSIAAAVILNYNSLRLVETQTFIGKTRVPYIPTLLAFREVYPTVECIRKLEIQPDVFFVDGHGRAHPYQCGLASHLGLVVSKPTIGVAKSLLVGKLKAKRNSVVIVHEGKIIGAQIIPKQGFKPIYVSVGHMISLKTAIQLVQHCTYQNRVPAPLAKAHEIATLEKKKIVMPKVTKERHGKSAKP